MKRAALVILVVLSLIVGTAVPMSSGDHTPITRFILRLLPDTVSLAVQRKLWSDHLYLDGLSDASRKEAVSDFFASIGDGNGEVCCRFYGPPFEPPWTAFPDLSGLGSMGFRMGSGEEYMVQFQKWYAAAEDLDIESYKNQHPAPEHYSGFYETLDSWHRRPSHATPD